MGWKVKEKDNRVVNDIVGSEELLIDTGSAYKALTLNVLQSWNSINVETLSGTKILVTTDDTVQVLDPDGSNRDVELPAETSSTGLGFVILNNADSSGESLVVKDGGGSTILTLNNSDAAAEFYCNGTSWYGAGTSIATTSQKGLVELATNTETITGTDTERAVTPAGLNAYMSSLVYGVHWDQSNSSPTMTAGYLNGDTFTTYDYTDFPIQEKMGRYIVNRLSGNYDKLDASDSTLYLDGSTASAEISGGAAGDDHVMVMISKFHQCIVRDGTDVYFLISEDPFSYKGVNSWIPRGFLDQDKIFIGAFEGVLYNDSDSAYVSTSGDHTDILGDATDETIDTVNDRLGSVSGFSIFTDETRDEYRSICANNTEAGVTKFFQMGWGQLEILTILAITEYKTWNIQGEIPGYTEATGWSYDYTRNTGRTLSLGDVSGSIEEDLTGVDSDLSGIISDGDKIANSYRGVENPFGHIWTWIDGINVDNRDTGTNDECRVYVCYDPDNYADDTTSNYIDTEHEPDFGDLDGYITNILGEGEYCSFYPQTLGGSSSTYLCDYHYNTPGDWRVLRWGGGLNSGDTCGFSCLDVNNASSSDSSSIGSRVACYV